MYDLQLILNTVDISDIPQPQFLSAIFHELQKTSSVFVDLGILDESGVHNVYHGPYDLSGKAYRDAPWFQQAIRRVCQLGYWPHQCHRQENGAY
jgi:two-component system NtrC family sensor kinase